MNILFVNYGDFTSNSLNHIAGFADALARRGHPCIVAVPERKATISAIRQPQFIPALFDDLLERPLAFPDGRGADIIHAWTPREVVRKFVVAYQSRVDEPARLLVHLEDNERHLLESYTGVSFEEFRSRDPQQIVQTLVESLPHPLRHEAFLLAADGISIIIETLREFVPTGMPTLVLPPGVDTSLYFPQKPDEAFRRELGLSSNEKIVVYTGSVTFANEAEVRDLYAAIGILNERGVTTKLIRTGITPPNFVESLSTIQRAAAIHLGFVEKTKLPKIIALADALVQPGKEGPFNDYRLPSKLPEFFASGRPVVLPRSNLGREVVDGVEALVLSTGEPAEIADACQRIFNDENLSATLRRNAVLFSRAHFDLEPIVDRLVHFYVGVLQRPSARGWKKVGGFGGSEIGVLAERVQQSAIELPSAFREQLELLGLLVRELENSLSSTRQDQVGQEVQKQLSYWKGQYDLTKQHLDHIEETFALTRRHAELLQRNLDTSRAELHQSDQLRKLTEAKLRDAQTHAHGLTVEALALKAEIARLDDLVVQKNIQQRDLLYQRDEKIRQITSSFSWKATAWLRALRRLLLDRKGRHTQKPGPLPPVAKHQLSRWAESFGQVSAISAAAPSFRYCLDYPQVWTFRPSKLVIRGWCFAADGSRINAVRACIGDRVYTAVYGLKRLDVLAALREYPRAEYSGFKIEVEIQLGDAELVLEAQSETGPFNLFLSQGLTVTAHGGIEELTSYEQWIEAYDTLSLADREAQRDETERWTQAPLVSVVIPVYNTPEKWLRKAVDSVKAQTYRHWELCLADDASPSPHVKPLLEDLTKSDPRIKAVYREKNGHISAASNSALAIATGELVALLDHDDEITPDALFEMVSAYRANPQAELIYSDEDKIDEEGRRIEPYFKPDFLPDLYVAQNYISHLTVYRLSTIRAVGGFREGYEGSQDWDLALRVIDLVGSDKIVHVSKILYHWRAIPGSTALLISEKNYPLEAARKALTDHFARKRQPVALITVPGDHWRVKYPLPSPAPRVALIIPTRNRAGLLRQCVDSILEKTTYSNFEVVVVDNDSDEPDALAYLSDLRKRNVRVIAFPGPFNYSAINNFAVQQVDAEIVGLLNNDLEVINTDWLDEMVSQAMRPEIGCVGAMLYYPTDRVQHAGVIVGLGGVAGHAFRDFPRGTPGVFNRARLAQNYSAVTAACLLVRRATYLKVGGLDEKSLSVAFNDIDFCLKVRATGLRNLWTPFAELYHHESASRGAEDTPEKHERFQREVETMLERWRDEIAHDPAYNPNLTMELNDFSLAAPPRRKKLPSK